MLVVDFEVIGQYYGVRKITTLSKRSVLDIMDNHQLNNKAELEQKIISTLDQHHIASFATVEEGKPKQRYMAMQHDGLDIHLATDRRSAKVDELKQNPNVSLLLGAEAGDKHEIVEIEGKCSITSNEQLRHTMWKEEYKQWFEGPDDPNYVVLDITPNTIIYYDHSTEEQVWHA
ncbi:pyridoxamine 5'-phosphate oxidase family protein [Paenibacillus turicensis]|uniref:pyridoxamine 5'-phosphate oxidase family protein n=1 Tax=Paenibacillus turicensis TaxID=160487 RepID=UPI003D2BEA8D